MMPPQIQSLKLPDEASPPLRSAADVLQRDLGTWPVSGDKPADLVLHEPGRPGHPQIRQQIEQSLTTRPAKDWHAVFEIDGALHVAGATPRSVAHAALALRDAAQGMDVATARPGFHAATIDERLVTWDQTCNQTQRFCRRFDRPTHFEEPCR